MSHPRHADPLPLGGEGGLPYSKGLMARALIAAGAPAGEAYELARRIEVDLEESGGLAADFERVRAIAQEVFGEEEGSKAIDRLRRYRELSELDLPIIILIGGGTGTGKSTVATEAAYRLGITRVTSTDVVRQTMRAFFSQEFMPSIHYSSFEAGRALTELEAEEAHDPVVHGFLEQTRNVLVGVRAAMDRALEEGFSMVIEGVHLVPGSLPLPTEGALVVSCVLAIHDEREHTRHFWTRDLASNGVRPLQKYLDSLSDIRSIQEHVVERAGRAGVPVIENENVEQTIRGVMELVLAAAAERLSQVTP
jgi:2-phosphoglycerate kinase